MWSDSNKTIDGRGGFLDETYNGQTNQLNQGQQATKGNSLVPLMIGHLLQDSLQTLDLWGAPIKLICLVAYVRKVERVTTKTSYDIVDETGNIMAHQWIKNVEDEEPEFVQAGSYARIIGTAREHDNARHVVILKIEPINSFADIFHHLVEVSFVCLKAEEIFGQSESAKAPIFNNDTEVNNCHGMDNDQAIVFRAIQISNDTETGIERSDLKAKVPASIRAKVDEILEFLTCEGHVYTTNTDDHFKTT